MKLFTRTLAAGAVIGATLIAGANAAVADDMPPIAVEDFTYPGADKIFKETGLLLKRGDGHIVYTQCDDRSDLIEVYARDMGKFCFKVSGKSGYLSLELPKVYGVKGNDYKVRVNMRREDKKEVSFDVNKNTWTPVGESGDEQKRDHLLLEIFASK